MGSQISDPYPVPSGGTARGTARVPASKSIAHRALILGALAEGKSGIHPVPDAQDVRATLACIRALGARTEGGERLTVRGTSGCLSPPGSPLHCAASGTTLRLLMALCAASEGGFTLDGDSQLRRRPVEPLARALAGTGAVLRFADREGFPPVVIEGRRWEGGAMEVDSSVSSQFVSGMLLAAPLARGPVRLRASHLVSGAYARMTVALMSRFGAEVREDAGGWWEVEPGPYRAAEVEIEPDASAAAFLLAAAAVTGGDVTVAGMRRRMLQGDAAFADHLEAMGCRLSESGKGMELQGQPARGLEADVRDCPDLVPPLVAVALFAPSPTVLSGVGHLRFKESDRLAVLADAVTALGGSMLVESDRLTVVPASDVRPARLDPHGDHRMAMAFAVMGLRISGTRISQPSCVAKSFPDFFQVLESLLSWG
ncbi:MAG: 3-phosphoshikimate 1-carboxyvinyltransferase [Acidobacteriota bacterium]